MPDGRGRCMVEAIRFAVLGPIRAWRNGIEVDTGAPQQQAVLAALLLREGAQASVDQLIDAVWGDGPPQTAAATVRTYIYRLRQLLDGAHTGLIESVAGGYALVTGPGTVDLARFNEWVARAQTAREEHDPALAAACLREGLTLWAGTPLAGVPGRYAETRRVLLAEQRLSATEELLAQELALGRHVRAAAELSALVAENPLRERLRELLMIALYGSGRSAAALAVFRDSRRLFRDELGLDPGPGLNKIHQRILDGDRTLAETPWCSWRCTADLPSDLSALTGRTEITGHVVALLEQPDGDPLWLVRACGP
ncbi:AfsR/SARP family transcriptional regulator [Yinghuangia seranimata]|uniref:AfsR/SARP family transcriptional regulator n=1 Tax=Yinghuangia seranimata TaxID=408067 RepID=UPI00248CA49B|nr:BTAD domain-containing putative transcriptional regulator [Yinghuangia seranimata]MDI2130928.1 BTAD domain-containing putative transcriptional regulator [Yinghuangia seranimata]